MLTPQREDIHIFCKHSNWTKNEVSKTLQTAVYNDAPAWRKFLHILLITLGIAFSVSGIVFFFAFNWENIGKYGKFAIVEGSIIAITIAVLLSKLSALVKNILLTGAAITVGAMFAVFGQVYQTGANAYDFFMAWTVFITLWVVISNFPPLWLVYLALINTTICLYAEQVAPWSQEFIFLLLFVVNTAGVLFFTFLSTAGHAAVPKWFRNILTLWTVGVATVGVCYNIFSHEANATGYSLFILTAIAYAAGVVYGLTYRSGFYLGTIAFSAIVIVTTLLLRMSSSEWMLAFVPLFIMGSVTLVIIQLIIFQKRVRHEK
jgi:uncharacterized membrane protein